MYIYNLPYVERRKICGIFDQDDKWEELAGVYMKFDQNTIGQLRRSKKPTDDLLQKWGEYNHTVSGLYHLFSQMRHYPAMEIIKHIVQNETPETPNFDNFEKEVNLKKMNMSDYEDRPIRNDNKQIIDKLLKPTNLIPSLQSNNISMVSNHAGSIPRVRYADLEEATNKWAQDKVLGQGGFGKVFKATWKFTDIAVKRLEQRNASSNSSDWEREQIKQTITELVSLNAYRCDNILPVYGYSIDGPQPCLIYQFMAGGSLESRLYSKDPKMILSWPTRLDIAIGTAIGLHYLHTTGEKGLVHGDIKSGNILLDAYNQPKIGDFGLARERPSNKEYTVVNNAQGTRPYLPIEFLQSGKFSTKVDTYSFGVVLFELATARKAVWKDSKAGRTYYVYLRDFVLEHEHLFDLKDKTIRDDDKIYDSLFLKLIEVGKKCVCENVKRRPEMSDTISELQKVKIP